MKRIHVFILFLIVGAAGFCMAQKLNTKKGTHMNNPLLRKSSLQYQAPEFDKIKDSDFKPAFDYALAEQMNQIRAVTDNPEPPTFANTILPLEASGQNLHRAQSVFNNLASANTNAYLQKIEEEYSPVFAAHNDKIFLDEKLYKRVKAVYGQRNSLGLDAESKRLVEFYEQEFEMAGADLSEEKKADLKKVNEELASLETAFANKLLQARKESALLVNDVKDLDGLNADQIAAAAEDAKKAGQEGKYLLALQNTTQQPLLQSLKNRDLRERLYKASWTRAEKGDSADTREVIEKIAALRLKKGQLLGKQNYAVWKLQDQMAKTPEAAMDLLAQLAAPSVAKAKKEAEDIQALIDAQGGNFKLKPWDWEFYSEQVRKQKYDLDESEIKPYFELKTVLEKGVFYAAGQLYGLSFKRRTDLPVYHPDVLTYEVFDHDGKSLAICYFDPYTRDNKEGGAWMSNYVDQSYYLKQKPVIVNVYNFQKPAEGKPSLISFDDVTTMFHEFGHALHGIFADQKYVSLSGTNVPRDFVEFPSQFNEQWALEPSVLKNYALHYQSKQAIPQTLVEKLKRSQSFNEGYDMTELVAAATIDMAWHMVADSAQFLPVNEFENKALEKYGLLVEEVPPRYHTPYFSHIWGGGYSAGYYAYLWTEMLDFDAFKWFETHGGLTRANGDRFRKYILSVGNSMDLNKAYENFAGRKPTIDALLEGKGLSGDGVSK